MSKLNDVDALFFGLDKQVTVILQELKLLNELERNELIKKYTLKRLVEIREYAKVLLDRLDKTTRYHDKYNIKKVESIFDSVIEKYSDTVSGLVKKHLESDDEFRTNASIREAYNGYKYLIDNAKLTDDKLGELQYKIGHLYYQSGDLEKSVEACGAAIIHYNNAGNSSKANEVARKIPSLCYKLGAQYMNHNDKDNAVISFKWSLEYFEKYFDNQATFENSNLYLKVCQTLCNLSDSLREKFYYQEKMKKAFEPIKQFFESEFLKIESPEQLIKYFVVVSKKLEGLKDIAIVAEYEQHLANYGLQQKQEIEKQEVASILQDMEFMILSSSSSGSDVGMSDFSSPDNFGNDDLLISGGDVVMGNT